MSKKKFLIISAVFPPEPVVSAKLSYDLALAVSETESVMVISPIPTRPFGFKFEDETQDNRFEHYRLNSYTCPESKLFGRLKETYSFGKATYEFIRENHDSISHIYSNTWPLFAQYSAVKAAKEFKIPITIHVQDIYPESLSNKLPFAGGILNMMLMPIDRYIFRNTTHIVAISEKMKHYLSESRKVGLDKISVVANWQDENAFIKYQDENSPGMDRKFTFMYLGNIGPVAGIDLLIESFVDANLKDCMLVIAGAGAMKETLQKQAATYPDVNIEFWPVPDGKVQEIQGKADIMLLPMKKGAASSSIPSKLPAYMFSKKPVIACVDEDSDTALALKEGVCGWVLPPENVAALSECMRKVSGLSAEELLDKGKKGFDYSIRNFSKKSNLQKLIGIIAK